MRQIHNSDEEVHAYIRVAFTAFSVALECLTVLDLNPPRPCLGATIPSRGWMRRLLDKNTKANKSTNVQAKK